MLGNDGVDCLGQGAGQVLKVLQKLEHLQAASCNTQKEKKEKNMHMNQNGPVIIASCPPPPNNIYDDFYKTSKDIAVQLHYFFSLKCCASYETNLYTWGVWLQSYITFSTCTLVAKKKKCDSYPNPIQNVFPPNTS